MRRNIVRGAVGGLLFLSLSAPIVSAQATVGRIENVPSVVAVRMEADFPVHSLMRATCDFVQRTSHPDGSATETTSCKLSAEPVMIAAFQGVPPTRALVVDGGPCTWISDYIASTTDEIVYADSFHLTVTPSGSVHATAIYSAEPASCE